MVGDAAVEDEDAGNRWPRAAAIAAMTTSEAGEQDPGNPAGRCSCWSVVGHASIQGSAVLPARMWFSIRRRYAPARTLRACVCLVVEDEPYMAEAIRDGLRLEAIAADIAG